MTNSIRHRLINWLEDVGNHAVKNAAKVLRGGDRHSQPTSHADEGFIPGIQNGGSQAQVNIPFNGATFREYVNVVNRGIGSSQFPNLVSNHDFVASLNQSYVGTHNSPLLAEFNQRSIGWFKESTEKSEAGTNGVLPVMEVTE